MSPDGKWIVSGCWDGTLKVWDATTGRELRTLSGHRDHVVAVAVSPDGKSIASVSSDGTLRVWEAVAGTPLDTIRVEGGPFSLAVLGNRIWVGCTNSMICAYDRGPSRK